MTRRLAAIMFTDIAGFTALSQKDEPAAMRLLQDQERLVRGLLEVHQGRLVKTIGDGLLIEFANALDAVTCAMDLQRHIHERNAKEVPPELRVRIGIHLGDVEGVGTDILGDAVNVASRIEPLAEPGGVCVSAPVFGLVRNKVPFQLEWLGPKTLKGVQEPLDVYRVVVQGGVARALSTPEETGPPRLAVLPLANISPDPKDEYFADGLTEELITVLSQFHELRVIARTSVTPYKAAPKPVAVIGQELGVGWVLEGSVRKAGEQLRITVQLIDVATQAHTWAETYDRKLEEIFAVQAEVAKKVAETLRLKLRSPERVRLEESREVVPESYLAFLRGRNAILASYSKVSLETARKEFREAISLDPLSARAYAGLAQAIHFLRIFYSSEAGPTVTAECRGLARRAIELDPNLVEAHSVLGSLLYDSNEWVEAEKEARTALSIDPSSSTTRVWYSHLLEEEVRPDEALRELRLAQKADPWSGTVATFLVQLLIRLRRLDEAKVELDRLPALNPDPYLLHGLLAYYHFARSEPAAALQEALIAEDYPDESGYRGPGYQRAEIYALTGEAGPAKELLRALESYPETGMSLQARALVYADLGDLDECFRLLGRTLDRFESLAMQGMRLEPGYEPLRRDPRFGQILKRMNLA